MVLNGDPSPENAPLLMAIEKGFFEDAGLEVGTSQPLVPGRAVLYVVDHSVDLSLAYEPEVVLARQQGAPVAAVAICGRPRNAESGTPRRIHARWM